MISTAGDAALTVADPSATATGHLVNGTFSLPQALQARAGSRTYAPVGGSASPTSLLHLRRPGVATTSVPIEFQQSIGADGRAAHRHLRQDADLHAVDHDAVVSPAGG